MIKIIIVTLFLSTVMFGQTDWVKWGKAEVSYELPAPQSHNYKVNTSSIGSMLLTGFHASYKYLISDLDGENCAFYPTCSSFFVQSVKQTNLLQGLLMFGDRFMRDTNFLKRRGYYPVHKTGKLFDPISNYTLIKSDVKYYSREIVVE